MTLEIDGRRPKTEPESLDPGPGTEATKSALILGATGQTGRHLLRELIGSPTFTRVCEAGRRVTPAADLPAEGREKLEQKVVDFERIDEAGLKEGQWDVVFVTCVKLLVRFLLLLNCEGSIVFCVVVGWARLPKPLARVTTLRRSTRSAYDVICIDHSGSLFSPSVPAHFVSSCL